METKTERNARYQREWYQRNKKTHQQRVADVKKRRSKENKLQLAIAKSDPCMDCGNVFPTVCMDFDHRDPETKSHDVSHMVHSYSWESVQKEINKCDLVCANCHRIRTHH